MRLSQEHKDLLESYKSLIAGLNELSYSEILMLLDFEYATKRRHALLRRMIKRATHLKERETAEYLSRRYDCRLKKERL